MRARIDNKEPRTSSVTNLEKLVQAGLFRILKRIVDSPPSEANTGGSKALAWRSHRGVMFFP
jgi:hypothetical protein